MERLCSLFFELSNEDRLNIILKLMDESMKLTHIAKELDLTAQEISRRARDMIGESKMNSRINAILEKILLKYASAPDVNK